MMDNRPDYIFCVMGLNRVGAIASLINTNWGDALERHETVEQNISSWDRA